MILHQLNPIKIWTRWIRIYIYICVYIYTMHAYYDFYRSLRSLERAIKRIPNCKSNWTHAWYSNSVLLNAFPASWEPSHPIYPACSCVHPKFIVIFNRSAASTRFPFASFLDLRPPLRSRPKVSRAVHAFSPFRSAKITKLSIVDSLAIFHEFPAFTLVYERNVATLLSK